MSMRSSAVVAASAAILLGADSALAQLADVDVVDTEAGTAGPGRRLAKDFEKSITTAVAWIMIASVKLITRRLTRA